ncbi:unnamed protein product, partial [Symbiodinium sp. CCMP2456]
VLCLPFLAHHLRWDASKTSEDIVIEVFELVREQTGSPVQLGVDVVLNPPTVVKDVKWLCADARVASAMMASSEGLELLSVNEPRLRKLMAEEMPLEKAKDYLQHIHAKGYTDEMLKKIPRTFSTLQDFKTVPDKEKEDFCQREMKVWMERVKESIGHCSHEGKDGGRTAAKALYSKALGGAVDYDDICQRCKDKPNFTANFVRPNLFTPTDSAKYKLPFDCVAEAAKAVLCL